MSSDLVYIALKMSTDAQQLTKQQQESVQQIGSLQCLPSWKLTKTLIGLGNLTTGNSPSTTYSMLVILSTDWSTDTRA